MSFFSDKPSFAATAENRQTNPRLGTHRAILPSERFRSSVWLAARIVVLNRLCLCHFFKKQPQWLPGYHWCDGTIRLIRAVPQRLRTLVRLEQKSDRGQLCVAPAHQVQEDVHFRRGFATLSGLYLNLTGGSHTLLVWVRSQGALIWYAGSPLPISTIRLAPPRYLKVPVIKVLPLRWISCPEIWARAETPR